MTLLPPDYLLLSIHHPQGYQWHARYLTCMPNRSHIIRYCQINQRLWLSFSILDPLLFLLNKLLTSSSVSPRYADSWRFYWSTSYSILFEIDQLQHECFPQEINSHDDVSFVGLMVSDNFYRHLSFNCITPLFLPLFLKRVFLVSIQLIWFCLGTH